MLSLTNEGLTSESQGPCDRLSTACSLTRSITVSKWDLPSEASGLTGRSNGPYTHCYRRPHPSYPHSHRPHHRSGCWPRSAGCSMPWSPFCSFCCLYEMNRQNTHSSKWKAKLITCSITVTFLTVWMVIHFIHTGFTWKSINVEGIIWSIAYHSIAFSRLTCLCSELFHHMLTGS